VGREENTVDVLTDYTAGSSHTHCYEYNGLINESIPDASFVEVPII
jgi:hypothetical protein